MAFHPPFFISTNKPKLYLAVSNFSFGLPIGSGEPLGLPMDDHSVRVLVPFRVNLLALFFPFYLLV